MNDIESKISLLENRSKEYINVEHVNNKHSEKLKVIVSKYKVEILIYGLTVSALVYFKPTFVTKKEIVVVKLKQPEADKNGTLQTIKKVETVKLDYGKFIGLWLLVATVLVFALHYYKK
jgi:hypothetical protein